MKNEAMNEFEQQLVQTARHLPYPQTPDIAAEVDWGTSRQLPGRSTRRNLAWASMVLIVALVSLLSVPSVRARLIEFLQIGGVRILLPEASAPISETTSETPLLQTPGLTSTPPIPSQDFVVSVLELDGATTLDEARQRVDFAIPLPAYPPLLGDPDHVFVIDIGTGSYIVLAWTAPNDPEKVELSLYVLGPGVRMSKGEPPVIKKTEINGLPAAFVDGIHLLSVGGSVHPGRLVAGPVLVWQDWDLTFRLEANFPEDEMLRIAESLEPAIGE